MPSWIEGKGCGGRVLSGEDDRLSEEYVKRADGWTSYRGFSGGQGVWLAKRENNDGDMVAIGLLALNSNR